MGRSSLTGAAFSSVGASIRVSTRVSIDRRSKRLTMGNSPLSRLSQDVFQRYGTASASDKPDPSDPSMWTPRSSAILHPFGLDIPLSDGDLPPSILDLSDGGMDNPIGSKLNHHFLTFIVVVFGSCGFMQAFPDLAYSFLEKDQLQLSPATATIVTALTSIPWSIKPLYGGISDMCPIGGLRRLPYIIAVLACTGAAFLSWASDELHMSVVVYCTLRVSIEVCLAWAMVCAEAIVVEKSERLTLSQSNLLQSVVQTSQAIFFTSGGICGSFMYARTSMHVIVVVVAVVPIVALCILVPMTLSGAVETRRKADEYAADEADQMSVMQYVRSVCSFLSTRKYLLFTIWLLLQDAAPQFRKVTFYFYVDELALTESHIAVVSAVNQTAILVSALIYPLTFGRKSLHWCFSWGLLVKAGAQLSSLILLSHTNRAMGVSDFNAALIDTFITAVVANINLIPLMTLCATMCPPGLEGIFFSFFSSMANMSSDLVQAQTSSLAMTYFGITAHQFDNVVQFKICSLLLQLMPITLIWMIPSNDELDGISSEQPLDPGPLQVISGTNEVVLACCLSVKCKCPSIRGRSATDTSIAPIGSTCKTLVQVPIDRSTMAW